MPCASHLVNSVSSVESKNNFFANYGDSIHILFPLLIIWQIFYPDSRSLTQKLFSYLTVYTQEKLINFSIGLFKM